MRDTSAAIIVIGNEILSGKVTDTNAAFLCRELRGLGVTLKRILVIPDELPAIAAAVRDYHRQFDIVFTSGGVGPTHDDITMEGIAQGLGRKIVRDPWLEEKVREYSPGTINEARLKMAEVPEGSELVFGNDLTFPAVKLLNIYILPGIPELFRNKFLAFKSRFAVDPFHMRIVYTRSIESSIAECLNKTLAAFPDLLLGSYPKLNDPEYRVRVTLESKDREYLDRAFAHLMAQLPQSAVVRTE
ncbi:MAG: competence/damage-inducible protein A [Deltaproteobacteria bacterium]|nr:competence/damage-inducible protein A [Deltaproteobacteria bacterium]